MISSLVISNLASRFIDDGIANILGLESLRHGTNFSNNVNIYLSGGDPNQGGQETGSTSKCGVESFKENVKGYFYLFKDSEFIPSMKVSSPETIGVIAHIAGTIIMQFLPLARRFLPKMHAAISGYNLTARVVSKENSTLKPLRMFIGIIGGTLSAMIPTLKFKYTAIDSTKFENDPDYPGLAYRTKEKVECWRAGLFGSLCVGINSDWYLRAKANPMKICTGAVQLITATALLSLYRGALFANPGISLAGALLL